MIKEFSKLTKSRPQDAWSGFPIQTPPFAPHPPVSQWQKVFALRCPPPAGFRGGGGRTPLLPASLRRTRLEEDMIPETD